MITAQIRNIIRNNTVIRHSGRGQWTLRLKIDHQQFVICPATSKRDAQWTARMLAIALDRFRRTAESS